MYQIIARKIAKSVTIYQNRKRKMFYKHCAAQRLGPGRGLRLPRAGSAQRARVAPARRHGDGGGAAAREKRNGGEHHAQELTADLFCKLVEAGRQRSYGVVGGSGCGGTNRRRGAFPAVSRHGCAKEEAEYDQEDELNTMRKRVERERDSSELPPRELPRRGSGRTWRRRRCAVARGDAGLCGVEQHVRNDPADILVQVARRETQ